MLYNKTIPTQRPWFSFLWLCYFLLGFTIAYAQTGNYVPTGAEAVNYGSISLSTSTNWATARTATPGYFAAYGTAIYTEADDTHNINGYVKHYVTAANQGFTFPVGTGTDLRTLTTSGTVPNGAAYGAAWILGNPGTTTDPTDNATHSLTALGTGVSSVSSVGQWDWIEITGSTAGITVTVSIPDLSSFGPASQLRLVGWDGSKWVNLSGTTGASGNTENSTLSGTMVSGIKALGVGIGCSAGTTAPILSLSTKSNVCPATTADLSTITASNTPNGSIITWHTATPASAANKVANPSAVAAGTYYAVFYDAIANCYGGSPAGSATSTVVVTIIACDADGDGVADGNEPVGGVNNPCLPAQPAGYTGYNASNSIWGAADCDGDGFTNGTEAAAGSDPYDPASKPADSDGDGVLDINEPAGGINNPCLPAQPAGYTGYNANNSIWAAADCDGDGFTNGTEAAAGSDPYSATSKPLDTDGDGIPDSTDTDDDNDGLADTVDRYPLDTDNDGTPNATDPDDDGDGIADTSEQAGKALDTDNDGTPNVTDTDDDNDGIPDTTEQGTLGPDGKYTLPDSDGDGLPDLADVLDTDGDGTPDSTDTDDDNDGLADTVDKYPLDTDNDGTPNATDTDDDGDGIADTSEQAGKALDTDNDGTPNATDTDDDNDGVLDNSEIGTLGPDGKYTLPDSDGDGLPDLADVLDTDGDGTPDSTDTDDDNDGLADTVDKYPLDTDNDGTPNATDPDDDGDGIADTSEQPGKALDTDNDGTPNVTDTDDDNDGIPDTTEQGTLGPDGKYTLPDSDGDGLPDLADVLDTDGDGIPDSTDTDDDNDGLADTVDKYPLDTDNDGTPNATDPDDDGDGIADASEQAGKALDTDNDGTPNVTDTDDDNDGVLDNSEIGTLGPDGKYTLPDSDGDGLPDLADVLDTDGDGTPDSTDTDDDNDGLADTVDKYPLDTDNDGTPNATDPDDDGDGIADTSEQPGKALDTDNDGTPNVTDTDDDNDGIPDTTEQGTLGPDGKYTLPDSDGDGLPDLADVLDTDGDGIPDSTDTDDDNDGLADTVDKYPLDTDNDGTPNATDPDDDGDGIADTSEQAGKALDTDNDGTPNVTDTDDDNDGVLDNSEIGTLGPDGKYTLPDSDGDGLPDLVDVLDTDGDGTPDSTDTDDDNDGLADTVDRYPLDTDNDGTPNATDPDDDGDGIADTSEQAGKALDTDNDGTPNVTDTDDDNDGIPDTTEQGTLGPDGKYTLPDSDGDGLPDLVDVLDTDGDGIPDSTDTDDDNDGILDSNDKYPLDTDNDGTPNATDTDDDGDGIADTSEQAGKALDTDNDGTPNVTDTDDDNDGIPDTTERGTLGPDDKFTLPDSDGDGLPDLADAANSVVINAKVFLQGPLSGTNMTTVLNTQNLIPLTDPYGKGASTTGSTLAANSVTDWVLVELRNGTGGSNIIESIAALLSSDGTLRNPDGSTPLKFATASGNYYVAIRHRNHIGVMAQNPIALNTTAQTIDFTLPSTATYGTNGQKTVGSVKAMWAGNATGIGSSLPADDVRQTTTKSDAVPITNRIAPTGNTTSQVPGYYSTDTNMDGVTRQTTLASDRLVITNNIATHPSNTSGAKTFVIQQSF
ncbi:hypothetical protein [Emticicia sp. SJ17W-69]|uniref:hypothetical protein n=1 Tax=Emticicia sp. SJ17W-69 TaxID=3421657 RepID=UPI003EB798DD